MQREKNKDTVAFLASVFKQNQMIIVITRLFKY